MMFPRLCPLQVLVNSGHFRDSSLYQLSYLRLRLIAPMFAQMCTATALCVEIKHRSRLGQMDSRDRTLYTRSDIRTMSLVVYFLL